MKGSRWLSAVVLVFAIASVEARAAEPKDPLDEAVTREASEPTASKISMRRGSSTGQSVRARTASTKLRLWAGADCFVGNDLEVVVQEDLNSQVDNFHAADREGIDNSREMALLQHGSAIV